MLKQTRFSLGLTLIVQAVSCTFLAICFLFSDKKRTAGPFTVLALISAVAGGFLVAEKVRERFDDARILNKMNDVCEDHGVRQTHEIPVDDTADEAEFN